MQGYGGYRGYNGFGDAALAQTAATNAYAYLQAGMTTEAQAQITPLTAADKATACQQMTTQAATDTDTTMKAKVSSLCAGVGGFLGLSTTTWIVIAVGGAGLIYLISSKSKKR
jgi:hypothetical protein